MSSYECTARKVRQVFKELTLSSTNILLLQGSLGKVGKLFIELTLHCPSTLLLQGILGRASGLSRRFTLPSQGTSGRTSRVTRGLALPSPELPAASGSLRESKEAVKCLHNGASLPRPFKGKVLFKGFLPGNAVKGLCLWCNDATSVPSSHQGCPHHFEE